MSEAARTLGSARWGTRSQSAGRGQQSPSPGHDIVNEGHPRRVAGNLRKFHGQAVVMSLRSRSLSGRRRRRLAHRPNAAKHCQRRRRDPRAPSASASRLVTERSAGSRGSLPGKHHDVARIEESGQCRAVARMMLHQLRVLQTQASIARLEQRAEGARPLGHVAPAARCIDVARREGQRGDHPLRSNGRDRHRESGRGRALPRAPRIPAVCAATFPRLAPHLHQVRRALADLTDLCLYAASASDLRASCRCRS